MTPLREYMRDVERRYILSALRVVGTCQGTARALGVGRSTLMHRMSLLGIYETRRTLAIDPLPRVVYRVRLRRWDGSWTVGTCALEALPVDEIAWLLHAGDAELVMCQDPAHADRREAA